MMHIVSNPIQDVVFIIFLVIKIIANLQARKYKNLVAKISGQNLSICSTIFSPRYLSRYGRMTAFRIRDCI